MTANIYFWGNVDRDPAVTRRRTLAVLAESPIPLRRRTVQQLVFSTDRFGASQTIQALRWLGDHKLANHPGYDDRKWRITEAGVAALALDTVLADGEDLDRDRAVEEFLLANREDMPS